MTQVIRNETESKGLTNVITVICIHNNWMQSALLFVPVVALYLILDHK